MKHVRTGIAAICIALTFAACGSGDTGESYNSTDTADLNTTAGPTDSATSAIAGDRGPADTNTAAGAPVNTNTNVNTVDSTHAR